MPKTAAEQQHWINQRAVIAKHRAHAAAARQQARYDPEALETAAYHDAEAERLEAELEAAGHLRPRGARYRRNADLGPLGQQLTDRMDALFADFSAPHAHEVSRWMRSNMMIFGRAPARAKNIQGQMEKLAELLSEVPKWGAAQNQPFYKGVWQNIVPFLGEVEALALKEAVVKEVQVDGNTFINEAGLSPDNFDKYVKAMSSLFAQVQGWRRGAFTGGATVVFAGPKAFRGTAGGVYRWKQDQLFVRATPAVLKRSSGTYGALDYIIIHELGHRFERKHRLPEDFDKVEWTTTKYSQKEGEPFAELFALGHFGMETVHGDTFGDRLARFEAVMGGSRANPRARCYLRPPT